MNRKQLEDSLALWKRRVAYRKNKHLAAESAHNYAGMVKWGGQLRHARQMVARRERQLALLAQTPAPRIITAAELGLTFQYVFGYAGPIYRGAWHYSAGSRAKDADALVTLVRSFHAYHKSLGWGGCSYPALVADDGTIVLANPISRKAAAVASNNTGMVGICVPGTTGMRLTPQCMDSLRWLKTSWHTETVPVVHRLPRPAGELDWRGHHEFPGQSTACPGAYLQDYRAAWA